MPPRSDDITLELQRLRLTLSPRLGGSICSLNIRDSLGRWAPLLREMPQDEQDPSKAGSFVMLPWTNRIAGARYRFAGDEVQLPANHNDGTAIHGIGRDLEWTIIDRSPITARLSLDSRTQPGAPYRFGALLRYEIAPDRVEIDLSVTNLDEHPIPVGCGHHPYFHRHLFSDADELRLRAPVAGRYPCVDCIPTADAVDDEVCASLRAGNAIGNPGLDDVFSGFSGQATLEWPESNIRLEMQCSPNLSHLVIYTPRNNDGSPDEFICVEPVSMVNDGFNRMDNGASGTGVVVLEPGQTMRTTMRWLISAMG